MTTYLVSTLSTFSNKYLVTAESPEQAIEFALDSDQDYYQLHLGEHAVSTHAVDNTAEEIQLIKAQGYF